MSQALFSLVVGAAGALPVVVRHELARRRRVALLRRALASAS
jgi:hypothetical protein